MNVQNNKGTCSTVNVKASSRQAVVLEAIIDRNIVLVLKSRSLSLQNFQSVKPELHHNSHVLFSNRNITEDPALSTDGKICNYKYKVNDVSTNLNNNINTVVHLSMETVHTYIIFYATYVLPNYL
jgi:hypothetical protein